MSKFIAAIILSALASSWALARVDMGGSPSNTYVVTNETSTEDLLSIARQVILDTTETRLADLNVPGFQEARTLMLRELNNTSAAELAAQMENMQRPSFGAHDWWIVPINGLLSSHFTTTATLESSLASRIDNLPEILAATGVMANQGEEHALDEAYPRYCSNCFRHVYWSALMSKYYGVAVAIVATATHEIGYSRDEFRVGDDNDPLMDIANDIIGVKLGYEMRHSRPREIYQRIIEMLGEGKIVIANPREIDRCVSARSLVSSWSPAQLTTYRSANRAALTQAAQNLTCGTSSSTAVPARTSSPIGPDRL